VVLFDFFISFLRSGFGSHVTDEKPKLKRKPRPSKPPFVRLHPDQEMIGRFIMAWSNVDAALDDTIWQLLRLSDEDGRDLTKRCDAKTKIEILRSVAPRHLAEPEISRLLDALDEADLLREDRNFVAHGTWATLVPQGIPVAISLRAKAPADGQLTSETFPRKRMEALIGSAKSIRDSMFAILNRLQPSRDK
jgi:hypothetical protein